MNAYQLARSDMGLTEIKGEVDEPRIVQMFADVGHSWVKDDETAWCAAAMGSWLKRSGLPHTGKLNARSYIDYGKGVDLKDARPGDIVVFSRGDPNGWQGHVGFFVKRAGAFIVVLGGNQSNMVKESRYAVDRLLAVRRPNYISRRAEQTSPNAPPKPTKIVKVPTAADKGFGAVVILAAISAALLKIFGG